MLLVFHYFFTFCRIWEIFFCDPHTWMINILDTEFSCNNIFMLKLHSYFYIFLALGLHKGLLPILYFLFLDNPFLLFGYPQDFSLILAVKKNSWKFINFCILVINFSCHSVCPFILNSWILQHRKIFFCSTFRYFSSSIFPLILRFLIYRVSFL